MWSVQHIYFILSYMFVTTTMVLAMPNNYYLMCELFWLHTFFGYLILIVVILMSRLIIYINQIV